MDDLEQTRNISLTTKPPILCRNKNSKFIWVNSKFLIPSKSSFLLGDVANLDRLIKKDGLDLFDFVIIDPPWQNRTVKRQQTYELFSNASSSSFYSINDSVNAFRNLPIPSILMPNGLLCLWVTNSQNAFRLAYSILEHWELKLIAQWHWLKVTRFGDPICDFKPYHKVPFETLILACRPSAVDKFKCIRDDFCIIR
jgi:hypothetical protein